MRHFMSKPKHVKCISNDGKRLSPVRTLAYDSGLKLYDREKDKDFARSHNDGTQILYYDIFNYTDCDYTDKTIPVAERMSNLANDLYAQNRQKHERLLTRFHFALPNYFSDEQLILLTKKLVRCSPKISSALLSCASTKKKPMG